MNKLGNYLSVRLLVTLVVITSLVMASFVSLRFYRSYQQMGEILQQHGEVIASRVSNTVRLTVWSTYQTGAELKFSAEVASAILDAELIAPEVTGIRVYGNFGHLFMGRVRSATGTLVDYDETQHHKKMLAAFLVVRQAIKQDSYTIGNVEVALNNSHYYALLKEGLVLELVQVAVVTFLLILLVFFVLQRSLVKPLRQIQIARSALENMDEGVLVLSSEGRLIDANPKFYELTGLTAAEVLHNDVTALQQLRFEPHSLTHILEFLKAEQAWSGELVGHRPDGTQFPTWLVGSAIADEANQVQALVLVVRDMTELKDKQKELEFLAFHDALTGLPNRANFERRLGHDIALVNRGVSSLAVLFIDLDDFKSVNDSLGHEAGDQLLVTVAERFRQRLRESDTLARIGGDEFTVILPGFEDEEQFRVVANDLLALASAPVHLGERTIHVGASIGIAVYPADGESAGDLLKHADSAMYRAKEKGRNRLSFYSSTLDEQLEQRIRLDVELRQALTNRAFELHYQPKVQMDSGKIIGFEALIRWRKPDGSLVLPLEFIPFAEERGLIIPIGRWVIAEAVRRLGAWQRDAVSPLSLAINLSPVQFHDQALVPFLREQMRASSISPQQLELEITESTLIHDMDHSIAVLHELRQLGFKVSIDDFGTGYSSLSYLKKLPIDCLKIDRSFIKDIESSETDQAITRAVAHLAASLHLDVVVEGVERETQIAPLHAMGCRIAQGYFFARPMPLEEAQALVAANTDVVK